MLNSLLQLSILKEEEWATPNEVVLRHKTLNLRRFGGRGLVPVLVLPPQAGHASTLADYAPNQSLVRLLMEYFDVYVTEWLSVTSDFCDLGIEDYINLTNCAVEHIGQPVVLIGECQGGWQASIYTSLYPERVLSLIVAASPIDVFAAPSSINEYVKLIPEIVLQNIVKFHGGVMPGKIMLAGFKSLQPEKQYYQKYVNLAKMIYIQDEKGLDRFSRFNNWYEQTHDLAGRFYLEVVKHIFRDNCLVEGGLFINKKEVDLRTITCPVVLIAGRTDHITPMEQVYAMENLVSSEKVYKLLSEDGHIGTLMGKRSLKDIWPKAIGYAVGKE